MRLLRQGGRGAQGDASLPRCLELERRATLPKNEILKIGATYCNNVAVGLTGAGILLPFLAISPKAGTITERLADLSFTTADLKNSTGFWSRMTEPTRGSWLGADAGRIPGRELLDGCKLLASTIAAAVRRVDLIRVKLHDIGDWSATARIS